MLDILDQQDAAKIDTTDHDTGWNRNVVALNPHTDECRRLTRTHPGR